MQKMSRGNNKSNAAGMYRVAGFRALMVELDFVRVGGRYGWWTWFGGR